MAMLGKLSLSAVVQLLKSNRPAWISIIIVLVLIVGWRGIIFLKRPRNLIKMTAEHSAIAEFWNEPKPNPAGTQILYQQSTANGVGLFLNQLSNGQRHLLIDKQEGSYGAGDPPNWAWSPDGKYFAFSHRKDRKAKPEVIICESSQGTNVAAIKVEGNVKQIAWLSSQALVLASERSELYRLEQLSGTRWGNLQAFHPMEKDKRKKENVKEESALHNLVGLTPTTVAFTRGQAVWVWEFGSPEPAKLWEATSEKLVDLDVDAQNNQLLVKCADQNGEWLSRLIWRQKQISAGGRITHVETGANNTTWFPSGGCAYLRFNDVFVRSSASGTTEMLSFSGGVNTIAGSGHDLYITGSRAGEPVAIWRYNTAESTLSCVVSNPQATLKYAKPVTPIQDKIRLDSGDIVSFRVWSPPKLDSRRKYPLLVGQVAERWLGYPGLIANGGAYVLSVDTRMKSEQWNEHVIKVIEHLSSTKKFDERQFYLFGVSGSTRTVVTILEKDAKKWRGGILFSPTRLPDIQRLGSTKLLIDCGATDERTKSILELRDEAAQRGVDVTVAVHEGAGHLYRSLAAVRERNEAVMNFIFKR